MSEHFCRFITGFHMEPGEDGDPIFCDEPAPIKWDGEWFCAKHYDECLAEANKPRAASAGNAFLGVDVSMDKHAVFSMMYGR